MVSRANDPHQSIRDGVRAVVQQFDSRYWQEVDEARAFPEAFVTALTDAGWLGALIPEEYGGSGLSLTEASVIMEEINRAGGNSGACHGQMYVMGCVLRHGSAEQKNRILPAIAKGTLRMQSMEQQVDTAYAFANGVFPRSPRIASISISGGVGVLMADAAARAGLQLPTPPAAVQQQIKALIPFSSPFNPYDVTAQIINDMGLFNRILALVAAQDEVDTVFIFLLQLGKVDSHFLGFRDALLEARRQHPHKLFVLCGGYSPNNRASMEAAGFLVFEEPVRAVQTVAALVRPVSGSQA